MGVAGRWTPFNDRVLVIWRFEERGSSPYVMKSVQVF